MGTILPMQLSVYLEPVEKAVGSPASLSAAPMFRIAEEQTGMYCNLGDVREVHLYSIFFISLSHPLVPVPTSSPANMTPSDSFSCSTVFEKSRVVILCRGSKLDGGTKGPGHRRPQRLISAARGVAADDLQISG